MFFPGWTGPYENLIKMFNRAEPLPAIPSGDWTIKYFPQIIENCHLFSFLIEDWTSVNYHEDIQRVCKIWTLFLSLAPKVSLKKILLVPFVKIWWWPIEPAYEFRVKKLRSSAMQHWHVFTPICHQLAKNSDGGYPSGYLRYPDWDPAELREGALTLIPLVWLKTKIL